MRSTRKRKVATKRSSAVLGLGRGAAEGLSLTRRAHHCRPLGLSRTRWRLTVPGLADGRRCDADLICRFSAVKRARSDTVRRLATSRDSSRLRRRWLQVLRDLRRRNARSDGRVC